MTWSELKEKAQQRLKKLPKDYTKRYKKEIREIDKQGANRYWLEHLEKGTTWEKNPNGLVLPWLLGMTTIDPIKEGIDHIEDYKADFPDIDLDFLPIARQTIKEYAADRYKNVCSVGNWNTYKPKSALQDAARAMGFDFREVLEITTQLPNEFDDLTLEDHEQFKKDLDGDDEGARKIAAQEVGRYQAFYDYQANNPHVVDMAYRMVGKIKSQGTHAGGLIIADRVINNIIPLAKVGENWVSQWTEGDKPQLSKFGLVKFDILGLKTMQYIWKACELIKETRGIVIDWEDMNPKSDPPRIGHEVDRDGNKSVILLNDPDALKTCNDLKTDSVFQIETDIQKGIVSDGIVKSFWDLVVYNALGRPGPMDMIPEYIRRRDKDPEGWKSSQDERIVKILESTFGVICYQEQLTSMWTAIAGFTVPEAEAARKVIAKKWKDKLPQVEAQWKTGAAKEIGQQQADEWWEKMVTFGRYAFNFAHSVAYSLITYMCLYLKTHYPAEWWASVMSYCHSKKLPKYMSAARLEDVQFGTLTINDLHIDFSVNEGKVVPGLQSIKNVGLAAAEPFVAAKGPFKNIDEIVVATGRKKTVYERLIKLGAFDELHPNRKALWLWYQYKYCTGKDITQLKKDIHDQLWPPERIEEERLRQVTNFKRLHPTRKVPKKLINFKYKPDVKRDEVMGLYSDYTEAEKIKIEKELLGYYWGSPLRQYICSGHTIEDAKKLGIIEAVVESLELKRSVKGNKYYVLRVTDGIQITPIVVWADIYEASDRRCFTPGVGIKINVVYNEERNSFRIANNTHIIPLLREGEGMNNDPVEVPDLVDEDTYPLW
jgi:DNA polymerase III alpha subunit